MPVWDGLVIEVWPDGDTFTVDLRREGKPDLRAEYSMRECGIAVEEGDLLTVEKDSVVKRPPRHWTQEEVKVIMMRARELSERLGFPGEDH